jgi:aryl carrier-like protein
MSGAANQQIRDEAQTLVMRVAAEILGAASVAPDDDFFAIGGDSLSAMHVIGQLRQQTNVPLSVRMLFEHPVLSELAERIAERQAAEDDAEGRNATDPRMELRSVFRDAALDDA